MNEVIRRGCRLPVKGDFEDFLGRRPVLAADFAGAEDPAAAPVTGAGMFTSRK